MSRGPIRSSGGVVKDVHLFLQNVNRNYAHVDYVLEALKDTFDILFIQEPPWRTIRQTVLTTSEEGNNVVGNPYVMAYVHRCLALLHPSMWWDIIDHRDLLVLSLFTHYGTVNLLNVYLDNAHTAINLLAWEIDMLPAFIYMGGDFNCHSEVWDPSCTSHPLVAQHLMELASDIGLEWACPSNPKLTHIPHNPDLASSVIDLVFTAPSASASDLPRLDLDHCGPSDHVPISTLLPISETEIWVSCMVIPRESLEESGFLINLAMGLRSLDVRDLSSPDQIEAAAGAVAEDFGRVLVYAMAEDTTQFICNLRNCPWDEDIEFELEAEMLSPTPLQGGDAEMAGPSTPHASVLPAGPPDPIMPVPHKGKGKKKHSSVADELTPPQPHLALSASHPATPAPPVSPSLVIGALFPEVSIFAPHVGPLPQEVMAFSQFNLSDTSANLVWRVTILNDSLTSLAIGHVFAAQGHTMPFDNSLGAPTLASALRDLLPCDALQHPLPTHGTADSAGPVPSAPTHGPLSEATAHPPLASKPAPPPRPTWSTK
ncbi:hypothetical protein AN958_01590 [Leucoagaricus sp. SymC.cos]|nr:hypothetical protein AN958_01590 [Leucoagaricus sp. SymC.cos]